MTEADQNAIDQIEADRKRRERELLWLLILLVDDSRVHAQHAVRLGVDPVVAARNVILGAGYIDQPGGVGGMVETMVDAYTDGVTRTIRMAGLPVSGFTFAPEAGIGAGALPGVTAPNAIVPGAGDLPASQVIDLAAARRAYESYAAQATQNLYRQIAQRIVQALQSEYGADVNARVRAIRDEMAKGGYTRLNPSALERMAETAVIKAYQDGYGDGFSIPNIRVKLKGFRYIAIIDKGTTDICRAYNGVQLPWDHIWWKSHAPSNHWGCRSTYRPIWRDFEPTTLIPSIEPEPGWGNAAISPLMPYEAVA